MILKGKFNYNKCFQFHKTPTEEIWVYERLFFELVIFILKGKTNTLWNI